MSWDVYAVYHPWAEPNAKRNRTSPETHLWLGTYPAKWLCRLRFRIHCRNRDPIPAILIRRAS